MTYEQIIERLEGIEGDLAERQPLYEKAASDLHRLTRDYDLRVARVSLQTKADTATEKKWRALDTVAAAADGLYENLKNAEGAYEGLKAAIRVIEQRASVLQSLLRSARETGA